MMGLDLDMGRYGFFVWGAWGVTALVLGAMIVLTLLRARAARRDLQAAQSDGDA